MDAFVEEGAGAAGAEAVTGHAGVAKGTVLVSEGSNAKYLWGECSAVYEGVVLSLKDDNVVTVKDRQGNRWGMNDRSYKFLYEAEEESCSVQDDSVAQILTNMASEGDRTEEESVARVMVGMNEGVVGGAVVKREPGMQQDGMVLDWTLAASVKEREKQVLFALYGIRDFKVIL